jgi:phenylalanyl-tRNA synthetase beta chain
MRASSRSEEFQIGRTSVLPGLLKSLACNGAAAKGAGLTLFEVTDVMLLDAASDVGARNERRLAVLYTGPTGGFEVVHGLIDRVMALLEVPVRPYTWEAAAGGGGGGAGAGIDPFGKHGMRYFVEPTDATPTFFNGRGANIVLERRGGERSVVGSVGVLHPQVLKNFELSFPTSVAEITIEPFVIYHSWAPRMDVAGRWIPPAE